MAVGRAEGRRASRQAGAAGRAATIASVATAGDDAARPLSSLLSCDLPGNCLLSCSRQLTIYCTTAMAHPDGRREGVTAVPTVPWGASESKGLRRTGPGRPGAREAVGIQISGAGKGLTRPDFQARDPKLLNKSY